MDFHLRIEIDYEMPMYVTYFFFIKKQLFSLEKAIKNRIRENM